MVLRLGFAWHYVHRFQPGAVAVLPFLFEPGNVARSLALGHGFGSPLHIPSGPTAWVAPVYPWLLAAIFKIFGVYTLDAFAAAALLNIVACAAVVFPLAAIGRRLGRPGAGALAGWLWAAFPNAIMLPVESMWPACLAALLGTIALAWALRLGEVTAPGAKTGTPSASPKDGGEWAGYGLLWALILMTAPALLSLLACHLLWLGLRRRRLRRAWAGRLALCLGVIALGCLPWTMRNARRLHAFIPLRSDLGLALWIGNNPRATIWPNGALHPFNDAAERARYLEEGEAAYMRGKLRAALAYMAADPGATARRAAARGVALWAGGEPHPWQALRRNRSGAFRFVLAFNLALGFGTLVGLALAAGWRAAWFWPVAAYPVVFPCAYYLTGALPRYLLPIQPVSALLAAIGLAALSGRWVGRRTYDGAHEHARGGPGERGYARRSAAHDRG